MLPPNPAEKLRDAPIADLIVVLLKQYRRLLNEREIQLTTAAMDAIAQTAATKQPLSEQGDAVRDAIAVMVTESIGVLQRRFDLTFEQSLKTDMDNIGGWETTGEFLEIANHKSNAELRISSGATLLMFLGDKRYSDALFTVIEVDGGVNDVDAMFAKRALSFIADVDFDTEDWEAQVHEGLKQ